MKGYYAERLSVSDRHLELVEARHKRFARKSHHLEEFVAQQCACTAICTVNTCSISHSCAVPCDYHLSNVTLRTVGLQTTINLREMWDMTFAGEDHVIAYSKFNPQW